MILILNNCIHLCPGGRFQTSEPQTQDADKTGLTLNQYSLYFDLISKPNKQHYLCSEDLLIAIVKISLIKYKIN